MSRLSRTGSLPEGFFHLNSILFLCRADMAKKGHEIDEFSHLGKECDICHATDHLKAMCPDAEITLHGGRGSNTWGVRQTWRTDRVELLGNGCEVTLHAPQAVVPGDLAEVPLFCFPANS